MNLRIGEIILRSFRGVHYIFLSIFFTENVEMLNIWIVHYVLVAC
ncbi:MAG: hypothetical protein Hyperionvirus2_121 [Hyperionvirus sp.]|uniref:Uncharacterized protein n=1 Tax=Hyperionvirus sp. TaxID=2487770 RepID=A0A3G5AA71_9VIRU|nr:MAG: hypothetical protein Hyperionvirus2_121 [Hyperionvirus sp.]